MHSFTLDQEQNGSFRGHDLDFAGWASTPEAIYRRLWMNLTSAAHDSNHGWHWPSLATVDSDNRPQVRTVVLRGADYDSGTLVTYTDRRSRKFQQIQDSPTVSWLFWDAQLRAQLRVETSARLRWDDQTADSCWEASPLTSRRSYLAPLPSGISSPDPATNLPDHLRDRVPTADESNAGRHNFAVIESTIKSMEWLLLGRQGNLSAGFRILEDGSVDGRWLTP